MHAQIGEPHLAVCLRVDLKLAGSLLHLNYLDLLTVENAPNGVSVVQRHAHAQRHPRQHERLLTTA